jgi:hypothetical protein
MLARWGRLMVAFAAALAVWAIATPAFASAPLCDPHGATGEAPAPQLQQPETSIDLGVAPDDCDEASPLATAINNGRAPEPAPTSASQDHVLLSIVPAVPPAVSVESFARGGSSGSERAGARARVDRPPRF